MGGGDSCKQDSLEDAGILQFWNTFFAPPAPSKVSYECLPKDTLSSLLATECKREIKKKATPNLSVHLMADHSIKSQSQNSGKQAEPALYLRCKATHGMKSLYFPVWAGKTKAQSSPTWTSVCAENLLVDRLFWDRKNDQCRLDCQDFKELTLFLILPSVLCSDNSYEICEFCPPNCSGKAHATSQRQMHKFPRVAVYMKYTIITLSLSTLVMFQSVKSIRPMNL